MPPSPRPCCRETACDEHMCSACLGAMMIYGADVAKTGSVMMVCPRCKGTGLEPEGAR